MDRQSDAVGFDRLVEVTRSELPGRLVTIASESLDVLKGYRAALAALERIAGNAYL